jgi:hypothetical protein
MTVLFHPKINTEVHCDFGRDTYWLTIGHENDYLAIFLRDGMAEKLQAALNEYFARKDSTEASPA